MISLLEKNFLCKSLITLCDYLQINLNTFLDANAANERNPWGYYDNNPFCIQDISGSSWVLLNPFTFQYETADSTMQLSCS